MPLNVAFSYYPSFTHSSFKSKELILQTKELMLQTKVFTEFCYDTNLHTENSFDF